MPQHTHEYNAFSTGGGDPKATLIEGNLGQDQQTSGITPASPAAVHTHSLTASAGHTHVIDPLRIKVIWGIRAF